MIVTADPDVSKKCKMLRDHRQDVKYHHRLLGVNGRLDEIQAAVLRVKLPHLDEWNEKRRRVAKAYETGLPSSLVKPIEMPWAKHVYHLYVIRTSAREKLQAHLEANGVATGMHYPIPIHLQEACRGYCSDNVHLPITENAAKQILSLPIYPELTVEEVDYICNCVREFAESEETMELGARLSARGG
jgi:dTDP-4-amino-4,6-dideoxygalactose transaminase